MNGTSNEPSLNTKPISSEMFVIGAGLPRTGTYSLRTALDYLGYHTYHAKNVDAEGHDPVWKYIFEASLAENKTAKELDSAVDAMLE